MRFNNKLIAVGMVAMLLLSGAAMAAPTVDTETTTTTTTSDLQAGNAVANFNASASDQLPTLQASYSSQNPEIQIIDPETDNVIKTVTNESNPDYFTSTGDDGSLYYFNTTFNESDFAAVPMGANENKSVELRLIDNSSVADPGASAMTNITITLQNTNERAVVFVGSENTGDDLPTGFATTADFDEGTTAFGAPDWVPGVSANDIVSSESDDLAVNSTNTDVFVVYADDNASSAYSDALDRGSAFGGETESGDYVRSLQLRIDSTAYQVYDSEVPDDLDADEDTYGVTTTVDGYSAVEVNLGEDSPADGADDVDVESTANDRYTPGMFVLRSLGIMTLGFGAVAIPVLVARPESRIEREGDSEELEA